MEEGYNGREQMHVNRLGLARGHGEAGQALAAAALCVVLWSLFPLFAFFFCLFLFFGHVMHIWDQVGFSGVRFSAISLECSLYVTGGPIVRLHCMLREKMLHPKIIRRSQTASLPSHYIMEGVFILHETTRDLRIKRLKSKWSHIQN